MTNPYGFTLKNRDRGVVDTNPSTQGKTAKKGLKTRPN
jgi:hypothetical protein